MSRVMPYQAKANEEPNLRQKINVSYLDLNYTLQDRSLY